jgi:pyruvate formate lyase activating enzyme
MCYNQKKIISRNLFAMGTCRICQKASSLVSEPLGLCLDCIRGHPEKARKFALEVHARIRSKWGLPEAAPAHPDGIACNLCVNRCRMLEGESGYCGLRKNVQGKIEGVSSDRGKLSWYHDPLPTNCVGDWVCPGGTGCGYPLYSYSNGPEYGYRNLAVFTHACTFHCLYCQNWQFRYHTLENKYEPVENLVQAVHKKTACICYFGGDPSPQVPFLIKASRIAKEKNMDRILRICWETNGAMSESLLGDMADSSLDSGGCIKFDLKAWDESLHLVLTGVTTRQTLENFRKLSSMASQRPEPPFLIASTLMVPGYIDDQEVGHIASFISSLNPDIPYSLLAFHPSYHMKDLPPTSRKQAMECLDAARNAGLKRVKVGNLHLLW